jgi:hypothetical protein
VSLWFADALRLCGHPDKADAVEQTLLDNDLMPSVRLKKK